MPHPTKGTAALAVLSLALMAGACNKGPAEDALEAADRELAAAKPEIETYAPAQLAPSRARCRRPARSSSRGTTPRP